MALLRTSLRILIAAILFGAVFVLGAIFIPVSGQMEYMRTSSASTSVVAIAPYAGDAEHALEKLPLVVSHVPTPEKVKAIYMTSWVASDRKWRTQLVRFIEESEINSVVIDIKDYTGEIVYPVELKELAAYGSEGIRVRDMKEFIADLHTRDIYVIGRIAVFQDALMVKKKPEWAVRRSSDDGVWRDRKGISWLDPGNSEVWRYAALIGKDAHAIGFDEINYDYIRYPSDGNMQDIAYPFAKGRKKVDVMHDFYAYLAGVFNKEKIAIPISADLFGMTTTNTDDLNIGQLLENALPYFDFIAPMVYPSHYPPNFNGWKDPNTVPGEVVKFSMSRAVARANAFEAKEAGFVASTSTPKFVPTGKYANKLRPWLQDFDYGGDYGEPEVRAQIAGTYSSGLDSWMIWDPANRYTRSAYDKE